MKRANHTFALLFLLTAGFTVWGQVKYTSVSKLLTDISDFSIEDKTLKIISNDQKAPKVSIVQGFLGDHPERNIIEFTRKAIVLTAFQVLHYSDSEEITITCTPNNIVFTTPGNRNTKKETLLPNYKMTARITRTNALAVVKSLLGAKSFKDLFDAQFDIKGVPNEKLKEAMYNEEFYKRLTKN